MHDPENEPAHPIGTERPPRPDGLPQPVRLSAHACAKAENFSHQTLLAGDSLTVELYTFGPGAWIGAHRHQVTEHLLTIVSGEARVRVGERWVILRLGETLLAPAGLHHSIHNDGTEPLLVQQVSAPKPWDPRFGGPHPSQISRS